MNLIDFILEIEPLNVSDIEQMVCDSFKCGDERATIPLAQLLHKKTMGNPFFVQQLLISFHEDGLITFDFDQVHLYFFYFLLFFSFPFSYRFISIYQCEW